MCSPPLDGLQSFQPMSATAHMQMAPDGPTLTKGAPGQARDAILALLKALF